MLQLLPEASTTWMLPAMPDGGAGVGSGCWKAGLALERAWVVDHQKVREAEVAYREESMNCIRWFGYLPPGREAWRGCQRNSVEVHALGR